MNRDSNHTLSQESSVINAINTDPMMSTKDTDTATVTYVT